jgi:hypothetical protein
MWNPFKSKSKIKLSDFTSAIEAEAKRLGNKHWRATINYGPSNFNNDLGWTTGLFFEAYIADSGIKSGLTISDVVTKFRTSPETTSPVKEILLDA